MPGLLSKILTIPGAATLGALLYVLFGSWRG